MGSLVGDPMNFFQRIYRMSEQLDRLVKMVEDGLSRAEAERTQVQETIGELKEMVLNLQTQPKKEIDLTPALNKMQVLLEKIDDIYAPPPDVEEKLTQAESAQQQQQGEDLTDETQRIKAEEQQATEIKTLTSDVPDEDIIVSIPDHGTQPPDAPAGVKFKD